MGDYYIQILGAENGGALYLSDVMSVYRSGVPGSWSETVSNDLNHWVSWFRSHIICYDKINAFTKNKYSNLFSTLCKQHYSNLIRSLYLDIDVKKSILEEDMNKIDIKDRILWNAIFKHPSIVIMLRSVHQLAKQVLSHRNRRHLKSQETLEKIRGRDAPEN